MIRRCAWHPKYFGKTLLMGEIAPFEDKSFTDGICIDCRIKLEDHECPVIEVRTGSILSTGETIPHISQEIQIQGDIDEEGLQFMKRINGIDYEAVLHVSKNKLHKDCHICREAIEGGAPYYNIGYTRGGIDAHPHKVHAEELKEFSIDGIHGREFPFVGLRLYEPKPVEAITQ